MMLKLSSREAADYIELINSYLDRNPFLDTTDFDAIIRLLSPPDPYDDTEEVEVPEHLRDYIEDIQELMRSPEDYASHGHHHVFIEKVRQRKRAKVEELSGMSREDRMHLIAQSRLAEIDRHLAQVELQRKQLPRDFLELPCPNLVEQLTADQLAALDWYPRKLLENANICRLVGIGKLSLDRLLRAKPFDAKFLLDNALLNLLISDILDESLFYSLDYGQLTTLTEHTFIYELMRSGAITFEKAISLDIGESSVLNSTIIACCLKMNLTTIDEALKLTPLMVCYLKDYQDKVINREMTIDEAINQRPVFSYI